MGGNTVYLLDESGRQFKTHLFQKILEPSPLSALTSASTLSLPQPLFDDNRKRWISTSGPDRYGVRIDGDFIYADQILFGSRWFKVEAKRSGNLYVGRAHIGVTDPSGRACTDDEQIEFTRITDARIEGALFGYPLDAQLDFGTCRYSKPKEIRTFAWVPE